MILRIKFITLLAIILMPLLANSTEVPKYFHYQGLLYNDVGEPLSDGKHNIYFRIIDSAEKVVYEEVQEVDVVEGAASAMIGAGLNPSDGAYTGGIGIDAIIPEAPNYLEVQVDGLPPEPLMEMVSVPYATYADVAFNVKEGSVGSAEIKEGSITVNHLSENFIDELTGQIAIGGDSNTIMVKEEFISYQTTMQGSEGAKSVGVDSDFRYSSSGNIQEVLEDLDSAIRKREEDVKVAEANLSEKVETTETNIRTDMSNADQTIKTDMTTADSAIKTDFSNADQSIRTDMSNADASIRTDFANADQSIRTDMSNADQSIRTDMTTADGAINTNVSNLNTAFSQHADNSTDAHGINNYMKTGDYIEPDATTGQPKIKSDFLPEDVVTVIDLDESVAQNTGIPKTYATVWYDGVGGTGISMSKSANSLNVESATLNTPFINIVFESPMANAEYTVIASVEAYNNGGGTQLTARPLNQTENGFDLALSYNIAGDGRIADGYIATPGTHGARVHFAIFGQLAE